jgi:hypothetical protein
MQEVGYDEQLIVLEDDVVVDWEFMGDIRA